VLTKINSRLKGRKGFTLVELLLVVAILAVLAFLAIPAIAETIRNSRMRTCASNERMVETNIWRWYADGIAAGLAVAGAEDGTTLLTIDTVNDTVSDDDNAWPELSPYFTPGGPPSCPFTNDATAYDIYIFVDNGGIADIICICNDSNGGIAANDGHPRSLDRRLKSAFPVDPTP